MTKERLEKIEISVNQEDVQNIIDCYEKDIKYIKQLQQENKQLKDDWNELKKYLEENLYFYSGYQGEDREEDISIKYVIDKIKELEESKKEGRLK